MTSDEIVVLKVFSSEIEATMAQQVLQMVACALSFSKTMPEAWEPHLQRTSGTRLLINRADAENARQILAATTPV